MGGSYQFQITLKIVSEDTLALMESEWKCFEDNYDYMAQKYTDDDYRFFGVESFEFDDNCGMDLYMDIGDDIVRMVFVSNFDDALYNHLQSLEGVEAIYLEWKCYRYYHIGWWYNDYAFSYEFPDTGREFDRMVRKYGDPFEWVARNLALDEDGDQSVWEDTDVVYTDYDYTYSEIKRDVDDWRAIAIWKQKVKVFGNSDVNTET
eukprot:Awhi_evm1s13515